MLYIHYFNLNNITSNAKLEKLNKFKKEIYSQYTFKPQINAHS